MGSFIIVVMQPVVQIHLQRFQVVVQFLAKGDLIKLLQNRLMETFTNAIRLRCLDLCLCVINVVDCQVQLIIMALYTPTELRSSVGQYPQ